MNSNQKKALIIGGVIIVLVIILIIIIAASASSSPDIPAAPPSGAAAPAVSPANGSAPSGPAVNTTTCPTNRMSEFVRNYITGDYARLRPHKALYLHNNCQGVYGYGEHPNQSAAIAATRSAAANAWGEQNIHLRDIDGQYV